MAALEEERFIFTAGLKKWIIIAGITGIVLFAIGVLFPGSAHHEAAAGEEHGTAEISKNMVASAEVTAEPQQEHAEAEHAAGEGHHGIPTIVKRIYASLWHNNIFFTGLGIIGLFFVAVQYAAQAGWSAPIKRIPLAMGSWIPVAGIIMFVLWWFVKGDIFHWTHHGLYEVGGADYDEIIVGKSAMWYWPLAGGTFPVFFLFRMVLFFGLWYMFFVWIRREMLARWRRSKLAQGAKTFGRVPCYIRCEFICRRMGLGNEY
jgi:hypothetical protein